MPGSQIPGSQKYAKRTYSHDMGHIMTPGTTRFYEQVPEQRFPTWTTETEQRARPSDRLAQ